MANLVALPLDELFVPSNSSGKLSRTPPSLLRITRYRYQYSNWRTLCSTGQWWQRNETTQLLQYAGKTRFLALSKDMLLPNGAVPPQPRPSERWPFNPLHQGGSTSGPDPTQLATLRVFHQALGGPAKSEAELRALVASVVTSSSAVRLQSGHSSLVRAAGGRV